MSEFHLGHQKSWIKWVFSIWQKLAMEGFNHNDTAVRKHMVLCWTRQEVKVCEGGQGFSWQDCGIERRWRWTSFTMQAKAHMWCQKRKSWSFRHEKNAAEADPTAWWTAEACAPMSWENAQVHQENNLVQWDLLCLLVRAIASSLEHHRKSNCQKGMQTRQVWLKKSFGWDVC